MSIKHVRPMVFSYYTYNQAKTCPLMAYNWVHAEGYDPSLSSVHYNDAVTIGYCFHLVFELWSYFGFTPQFLTYLKDHKYRRDFAKEFFGTITYDRFLKIEKTFIKALGLLDWVFDRVSLSYGAVEVPIYALWKGRDYPVPVYIGGRIDFISPARGGVVVDWKFGKYFYKEQQFFYAYLFSALYGFFPKELMFIFPISKRIEKIDLSGWNDWLASLDRMIENLVKPRSQVVATSIPRICANCLYRQTCPHSTVGNSSVKFFPLLEEPGYVSFVGGDK